MITNILRFLPEDTKIKIVDPNLSTEIFSKKISELSNLLNIPLKNMSRYKIGNRGIPLSLFNKLIKITELDISNTQGKMAIKINKNGKYITIGPEIDINSEWIYVSELIKGDGHIPSNFRYITFVNNNSVLIEHVRNFFLKQGLDKSRMGIIKRPDADFLTIYSMLFAQIFNKILSVPLGKKGEIPINDFVMKNEEFGKAAVRGAFDAEGSIGIYGSRRITISSNSTLWLEKLKEILDHFKIKSRIFKDEIARGKPIYRLAIYNIINIKRFYRIIKPIHSERVRKFKDIMDNANFTPKGLFPKKVLKCISEGKIKRVDIAKELNRKICLIGNDLRLLKRKNLINAKGTYTNHGSFYEYGLTESGRDYLKNNLDSFLD